MTTLEQRRAYKRRYVEENKEKVAEAKRQYVLKYPDRVKASKAAWSKRNPEKRAAYQVRQARKNRAYYTAKHKEYMTKRANAFPAWANTFFIEEIYQLAKLRSEMLGVEHEVDHIVPLQSPLVCGLHCEANLRVITAKQNAIKKNYWWPEMPEAG